MVTSLDVAYRYQDWAQARRFFDALEIKLVVHAACPPQPVPGQPYRGDVFAQFVSLIPGSEWIEQPGHSLVAGQPVFVWCGAGPDQALGRLGLRGDYSQRGGCGDHRAGAAPDFARACGPSDRQPTTAVCPKYYPAYFEGEVLC